MRVRLCVCGQRREHTCDLVVAHKFRSAGNSLPHMLWNILCVRWQIHKSTVKCVFDIIYTCCVCVCVWVLQTNATQIGARARCGGADIGADKRGSSIEYSVCVCAGSHKMEP